MQNTDTNTAKQTKGKAKIGTKNEGGIGKKEKYSYT